MIIERLMVLLLGICTITFFYITKLSMFNYPIISVCSSIWGVGCLFSMVYILKDINQKEVK